MIKKYVLQFDVMMDNNNGKTCMKIRPLPLAEISIFFQSKCPIAKAFKYTKFSSTFCRKGYIRTIAEVCPYKA